jgi:acyl-coenzyme A thioesterase PaaI-like protein
MKIMEEQQVMLAVQDFYGDETAHCYGCGRMNEEGHHFRTGWYEEGKTITYYKPKPEHTAIPGFVYGGLLASYIDCHSTGSASLALHRKNGNELGDGTEPPRFVTGSLHVDYLKPTPQNVMLKAIGTIEEIHPKKWKVTTEVFAGETLCVKGEVIAIVMPSTFRNK